MKNKFLVKLLALLVIPLALVVSFSTAYGYWFFNDTTTKSVTGTISMPVVAGYKITFLSGYDYSGWKYRDYSNSESDCSTSDNQHPSNLVGNTYTFASSDQYKCSLSNVTNTSKFQFVLTWTTTTTTYNTMTYNPTDKTISVTASYVYKPALGSKKTGDLTFSFSADNSNIQIVPYYS